MNITHTPIAIKIKINYIQKKKGEQLTVFIVMTKIMGLHKIMTKLWL